MPRDGEPREAGYREALRIDAPVNRDAVRHIDPADPALVRALMEPAAPTRSSARMTAPRPADADIAAARTRDPR